MQRGLDEDIEKLGTRLKIINVGLVPFLLATALFPALATFLCIVVADFLWVIWGFDALVIPHGLAWGTTNPLTADFRDQLDEYEQRYEKLLEVYSGPTDGWEI